jgi:hypothetical protein
MRTALKVLVGVAMLVLPVLAFAQGEVLYVVNDKVGIRTASPYFPLDVAGAIRSGGVYVGINSGYYVLDFAGDNLAANANVARFGMSGYSNGFTIQYKTSPQSMVYAFINGNVGIGTASPAYPLHMSSGAYVSAGGVWTNASSRAFKQDIADLSADTAVQALDELTPVTFAYTADPSEKHVGFIAEDVPALVATGDRTGLSPMDVVAVLTKVLQEQQKTIAELQARVAQLETK